MPFATPTGRVTTARNGQAWVDPATRRIVYSPPSLFYAGAADSFSYSIQGTAGAPASSAVTVHFSGQISPATALSSLFARTGLDVVMDSFHSEPSSLVCDPDPGDNRPENLNAFITDRCWSFGDAGTLPTCDAVPLADIYYVPSLLVLCVDADGDGYHDPNGECCRVRYTAVRHSYPQPGEYTTLLKIRDSCAQEDIGGSQLDLRNQRPTARFTSSCYGAGCSFSGAGSTDDYGITRYRWDFGHPGPPAEGVTREHEFPGVGSYQVALVVEDAQGASHREEKTVTIVDAPPVAGFEWSCADLTCTFTDLSYDDFPPLADVRFRWRHRALGTSGVMGVGSPVRFTVPVPGPYAFKVEVTDRAGNVRSTTQNVDVLGVLTAEPDWAALAPNQTTVDLAVLANDRSPVGGLHLVAVKPPGHGSATFDSVTGVVHYTLAAGAGSLADSFGYEVVDAAGHRAGGQIRIVRKPIAQVGWVGQLTTTRQRVNFATPFSEPPLVFAQPVSRVYADAVSARIVGVDAAGFTIFLQEPEGTADGGAHPPESVPWLAVLPTTQATPNGLVGGTASLGDGALYAAGRLGAATHAGSAGGQPVWATLGFPKPIVGPDVVVLAQTQTENDPSWATVRVDEISTEGFKLALQPREASLAAHGAETVAWLAVPAGLFETAEGATFEAGKTAALFTETPRALDFRQTFPRTPLVLAGIASARDRDPAVLRHRESSTGGIELAIHEEASYEADLAHSAERVAYLAFDEPALFAGSRNALLAGAGDLVVLDDAATFVVSSTGGAPTKVCPIDNDSTTAGPLEVVWFDQPRFGRVKVSPTGLFTYTPAPGVCTDVEVPYGVTDAAGRRALGTIDLKCGGVVEGINFGEAAPSAPSVCEPGGSGGGEEQ